MSALHAKNSGDFLGRFEVLCAPPYIMDKILRAGFFVLFSACACLASSDDPAQQLLIAAEQQANIFQSSSGPFQLEMDFSVGEQTRSPGHMIYKWESNERWWRKITLDDFEQSEIKNGDNIYITRNLPFKPPGVNRLLHLLNFAMDPTVLQAREMPHATDGACPDGVQLDVRRKEKRSAEAEVCIHRVTHDVLFSEWKVSKQEGRRQTYSDYMEFFGHRYPGKMELFENGVSSVVAHVVSLQTSPLDPALLVPAAGAIERRRCAGMKPPSPIKMTKPSYPKTARRNGQAGDTIVTMTILSNGSVDDIQVTSGSADTLDDSAMQALRSWTFHPAMCGTEAVVSDAEVVVRFRLR